MSNGQWQPPPAQGPWGQQPQQPQGVPPQQGYPQQQQQPPQAPPYVPPQQQPQMPQGYAPQPPVGYAQPAPTYPQQPQGGYPQQQLPPQQGGAYNPFGNMNSGEQMRSLPFLANDEKDGPVIEGDYKLRLTEAKYKDPIRTGGGKAIILSFDILESNQPRRPAGMSVCVFLMQGTDMAGVNTTAWVAAMYGVDPLTLPPSSTQAPWVDPRDGRQHAWGEYAWEASGGTNPWKGRDVGCSIVDIEKKKKPGERFGRTDWKPFASMVIPQRTFAVHAPSVMAAATPYVPNGAPQPGVLPQGGFAPPGAQAPAYPAGQWTQAPQGAPQQPAQAPQQAQYPGAPPPGGQWNAPVQQPQGQPAYPQQQPQGAPPTGPWGQPPR